MAREVPRGPGHGARRDGQRRTGSGGGVRRGAADGGRAARPPGPDRHPDRLGRPRGPAPRPLPRRHGPARLTPPPGPARLTPAVRRPDRSRPRTPDHPVPARRARPASPQGGLRRMTAGAAL
ncbi:protein of unknown function [Streptomyces sp. KY75]|nr:protein of unknown function [Streptomyces sp. KY75]CAD5990845.1 protein of unknown function [Streptomyces sp. KY70]